jgi:hypothetical protein
MKNKKFFFILIKKILFKNYKKFKNIILFVNYNKFCPQTFDCYIFYFVLNLFFLISPFRI